MTITHSSLLRIAALLVSAATIAGCGDHHGSKTTTQVAAKVGSYEITSYQVSSAVARLPNVTPAQLSSAKSKVLDNLVTQQLAIAQAQKLKLDRQPNVVAALDAAQREVLATAYFEHVAQAQPKPTDDEVHTYFQAHPELFGARRLYTLKEVTLAPNADALKYARDFAAANKPIEQFSQWLQDKGIRFTTNSATRAPETLPLDFLPQLAQAKDGGIVIMSNDATLYVAQLMGSRPAPVAEADASTAIRRYLENLRSKEALEGELARLRAETKIEYAAEYATGSSVAQSPTTAVVAAPPKADVSAKPGAIAAPDSDSVQRGIGGMK